MLRTLLLLAAAVALAQAQCDPPDEFEQVRKGGGKNALCVALTFVHSYVQH